MADQEGYERAVIDAAINGITVAADELEGKEFEDTLNRILDTMEELLDEQT